MLATELKNKIRSGWLVWEVDKERLESVAEHIYGTCILAISINSEFNNNIDLKRVIFMLVLHELEEVIIGDLTPFDNVTKEEKRKIGKEAVEFILKDFTNKEEYINLINEYVEQKTKEAMFAKICDVLEADIQAKLYSDEMGCDVENIKNAKLLEDYRIKELISKGSKTVADLFIENDRKFIRETEFENLLDYVKNTDIFKLRKELLTFQKNRKVN